ncbi:CHAT domain-containing protein [Ilyonectria destructans]|nr:CHAT domain-containing protein [Ilyonectria destructans]
MDLEPLLRLGWKGATPTVHPGYIGRLNNLGVLLKNKYSQTGNMSDLEEIISVGPGLFNNLSIRLGDNHSQTDNILDLEQAILIGRELLKNTPRDHPERVERLNTLNVADLEEAIKVGREAIEVSMDDYSDRPALLNNLSLHLDLDEAIILAQKTIETSSHDHPNYAERLSNLSIQLDTRYSRTEDSQDLQESIKLARIALETTPQDHPELAARLHRLSHQFNTTYSQSGALADLEEAIAQMRGAIKITPPDHPDLTRRLHSLGLRLGDRYSHTGELGDVEEAISMARRCVKTTPKDDLELAERLHGLGIQLSSRYYRTGAVTDLEEAIGVCREAIKTTPQDDPYLAGRFHSLGIELGVRFARTKEMGDIGEAIVMAQKAVKASLGSQFGKRYSHTGAMADLEEAINAARAAIKATPQNHPSLIGKFTTLSIQLRNRYSRIGGMEDLEEAIKMTRSALEITPQKHRERPGLLSNLGIRLGYKYSRTKELAVLNEAISVSQEAIEAFPHDHPERAIALEVLSIRLRNRYSRTRDRADLEEAISMTRKAIDATPRGHPRSAGLFSNLGVKLRYRYLCTRAMEDLEESINASRMSAEHTPADDPNLASRLSALGIKLRSRYLRTKVAIDLEDARECYDTALNHQMSPINFRIKAGRTLLSSADFLQEGDQAYLAAKTTIELVPLLSPPSLRNKDKQHLLSEVVGLASDAAAIALIAGKGPLAAIQLLETGRGVLASSLQDLRADLSVLQQKHPQLADSFIKLRDQLDAPPSQSQNDPEATNIPVKSDRRHEAVNRMPLLLKEIRDQHGFQRFLLPSSEAEMKGAAAHGPIVILNVSSHRCDALILEQTNIRVVELHQLSRNEILKRARHLQSLETLGWLWNAVVKPVLDALGFTEPPSGDSWPHLWWIPTGPLAGFPLHAAGHHLECNSSTALDSVVSSYSTSIKTIIHHRHERSPQIPAEGSGDIILVAMHNTPEQKSLQHTRDEISAVQTVCESMGLACINPKPNLKAVLSALETCMIFHFAGHGAIDEKSPLASLLLLEDWKQDPLTIGNLLETNLSSKSPFLAYLSACGTGQIRDKKSIDESIHLTSAFQLAGFRHVVGTLWEVDDELCVRMARLMYQFLQDFGMNDESVSYGLHHATRKLRDYWVQEGGYGKEAIGDLSLRDVVICGGTEPRWPLWVPYVHYGV